MLNLIFMGSPEFSVPILDALIQAGHTILAVYSQPPRPADRGQKEKPCAVHAWAQGKGLTVHTPEKLKAPDVQQQIKDYNADAIIVAAYGLLLPKQVLDAARLGCINVHPSLLPRWRGAAPIQWPILAGDTETGVTIMQMDEGLDTGPMLSQERTPLPAHMTASVLHDQLAAQGATLLVNTLTKLEQGKLVPTPQPKEGVTYASKLSKEMGNIDWNKSAVELDRLVRAMTPWPGTFFRANRESVKLLRAEPTEGKGPPGTALDDRLTIACGAGALRILEAQRPSKKAMETDALLRGFPIPRGTVL